MTISQTRLMQMVCWHNISTVTLGSVIQMVKF
jgi:hypothetical protein